MTCVPIRLVLIAEHCFMYFLYYIKTLWMWSLLRTSTCRTECLLGKLSFGFLSKHAVLRQSNADSVRTLKLSLGREHAGSRFFLQISLLETWTTFGTPRTHTPSHFCSLGSHTVLAHVLRIWVTFVGICIYRTTTRGWGAKPPFYLQGIKKPNHDHSPQTPQSSLQK